MRSPKDKFSASITFNKYVEGIGQSATVSGNTMEEVEHLAASYKQQGRVVIRENKAEYPRFDWVTIKEYNL